MSYPIHYRSTLYSVFLIFVICVSFEVRRFECLSVVLVLFVVSDYVCTFTLIAFRDGFILEIFF